MPLEQLIDHLRRPKNILRVSERIRQENPPQEADKKISAMFVGQVAWVENIKGDRELFRCVNSGQCLNFCRIDETRGCTELKDEICAAYGVTSPFLTLAHHFGDYYRVPVIQYQDIFVHKHSKFAFVEATKRSEIKKGDSQITEVLLFIAFL